MMEKLSPRCKLICAGAAISLATAIAAAPAPPNISFLFEDGARERGGVTAIAAPDAAPYQLRQLPSCTGGESVNCHTAGNKAGL